MEITYGVQQYAWGKVGEKSMVAKLKAGADSGFAIEGEGRYAEMWIGTHPKCPSEAGGKALREQIDEDLPFLLKVLSIDKALSIQAHPVLAHAKELHARDPKNYPDPNHKPELLVAITPVSALACFRKPEAIAAFAASHPTLAPIAPTDGLKPLMAKLLAPEAGALATAHEAHLKGVDASTLCKEDQWFLRLIGQFPGDSGALMIYVLNLVELAPGQGVFLKPNEPHAYLSGDGVEIMAKSDNVVRAGLTPKFKDAETLLGMMTYDPEALGEMALPYDAKAQSQTYCPPASIPEFQLTMHKLGGGHAMNATHTAVRDTIMLVVKGAVKVDGSDAEAKTGSATLFKKGSAISVTAVPRGEGPSDVDIEGEAVVFMAEPNTVAA